MELDMPLDYAAFQLSPRHSRCELFVSVNGNTEKLASGLVKPFMTHLKVVEEQVASSVQSIKLEVDKRNNVDSWFTKGTLERFVRFVSTPEIVELVITYDAEMSQLEAARRIYSQGPADQLSNNLGDGKSSTAARADATKKELLRAIDLRLTAVKQDLNTTCARAAAAGFNRDTVSDLRLFAERFGATRLNEACCKYISLYERRPELFSHLTKSSFGDEANMRCSYSSDMSIDDDPPTISANQSVKSLETCQPHKSSTTTFPLQSSNTPGKAVSDNQQVKKDEHGSEEPLAQTATLPSSRRLSVQDRINLFENKQKEVGSATGSGGKPPTIAKPELRRLSSDVSNPNVSTPPAVLRRWSGAASDMSIDLSGEKKENDSPKPPSNEIPIEVKKTQPDLKDQVSSSSNTSCRDEDGLTAKVETGSARPEESVGSNEPTSTLEKTRSLSSSSKPEDDSLEARIKPHTQGIRSFQEEFGPSNVEGPFEPDSKPPTSKAPLKRVGSGSKMQEAVAASQHRGLEIGSLRSQTRSNYSAEAKEEVDTKDYIPTEKEFPKKKGQNNNFSNTPSSGKLVQEMPSEPFVEQVHRSRQLKGKQELNDELKLKANELEKFYAEHKLRVPGDQPNYARQSKPSEVTTTLPLRNQVAEPVSTQVSELKSPVQFKEVDGQNHRDKLERSFSDASRGKFYDSYMKKREERLREQWGSNKAEKEARMKAMHDSLERSSVEMKTKLSLWSADRHDSVSSARRRAERLRSFNDRSTMKLDFGQLEDDEDLSEPKLISNGVSRGKKPLPMKNSSTTTPRTPVPRSGPKLASSSGKRRVQSENPLAQSVPNFSDLRKENSKPYSVASKAAARSQLRNHTRSRSTNEEVPSVREEKAGRSQSLRKNSPTPPENSEGVILMPLKFEKEQSEGVYKKSFHRKSNSIGGKMKVPLMPEVMMKNEEEEEDDDEEKESDIMEVEAEDVVNESLIDSESGNGQQTDPNLATELPGVQDSPGESPPMSWNSRIHYPFSYTHEASDNDASVESWNLNSTEADVARMRKKWGNTQKHILVANSSSSGVQSRKDMTKGFKRLLKFGRKSRGTDSLADWISATTSEGDDDTEDGRGDVSNRSSDELRKSRMGGYSHEGSFSETDLFTDQVHTLQSSIPTPPANFRLREDHLSGSSIKAPRSFFSLSSFRSKGSDSKLR